MRPHNYELVVIILLRKCRSWRLENAHRNEAKPSVAEQVNTYGILKLMFNCSGSVRVDSVNIKVGLLEPLYSGRA